MEKEIEIPLKGVKPSKTAAFKDLITRYLSSDDPYNNRAVFGGIYKAFEIVEKKYSLKEILSKIDKSLSPFQLNWVINVIGEYAINGSEVKTTWDAFQKSLEPKKKTRKKQENLTLED